MTHDSSTRREERTRRLMAAVGAFEDAITRLDAIPLREYPRHAAQLARIRRRLCADIGEALAEIRNIAQVVLLRDEGAQLRECLDTDTEAPADG